MLSQKAQIRSEYFAVIFVGAFLAVCVAFVLGSLFFDVSLTREATADLSYPDYCEKDFCFSYSHGACIRAGDTGLCGLQYTLPCRGDSAVCFCDPGLKIGSDALVSKFPRCVSS